MQNSSSVPRIFTLPLSAGPCVLTLREGVSQKKKKKVLLAESWVEADVHIG